MTNRELEAVRLLSTFNVPEPLDLIRRIDGPDAETIQRRAEGVIVSGDWSINDVNRAVEILLRIDEDANEKAGAVKAKQEKRAPKDDVTVTTVKAKKR